MTIYMRFPDEQTAQTVMAEFYNDGWNTATLDYALDPIGDLYKNDGVYDEQCDVITPPTKIDGWHLNFIGVLSDVKLQYQIYPATPSRIFSA